MMKEFPARPMNDRVIVNVSEVPAETVGGLIIPETAQEKPLRGVVVAVGPGRMNDSGERLPMSVQEGDVVIFGKFAGTSLKVGGHEFQSMREEDIVCVEKS